MRIFEILGTPAESSTTSFAFLLRLIKDKGSPTVQNQMLADDEVQPACEYSL